MQQIQYFINFKGCKVLYYYTVLCYFTVLLLQAGLDNMNYNGRHCFLSLNQ